MMVMVTGSRSYSDVVGLTRVLDDLLGCCQEMLTPFELVVGDCPTESQGVQVLRFPF